MSVNPLKGISAQDMYGILWIGIIAAVYKLHSLPFRYTLTKIVVGESALTENAYHP